jgi:hypothetical protein
MLKSRGRPSGGSQRGNVVSARGFVRGGLRPPQRLRVASVAVEQGGERRDGRLPVDVEYRDASKPRVPPQLRHHPRRQQRVATQVAEEVVVHRDGQRTEEGLPDLRDAALRDRARGGGSEARSCLPLGSSGNAVTLSIHAGAMYAGSWLSRRERRRGRSTAPPPRATPQPPMQISPASPRGTG